MSEATIRAALDTIVSSVTDIGTVHDFERWSNEWNDFLTLFKTEIDSTDEIRGWEITYGGYTPSHPSIGGASWREFGMTGRVKAHTFYIRGYLGVYDSTESEKTAAALANLVCDTLDADTTIRGSTFYYAEPANLLFESRLFGGVLCHFAQITQVVVEVSQ